MFSSKYLTIVAKIRAVVATTRADGDHWRRTGAFARIAIRPSFRNLLYRLFADLQMAAQFRILFQPCSSLEIILTGSFSLKACCKRWRRSKKSTSRPQLHVQDCSSWRITYYCFRQGSICDSEIIFRSATTFSSAPCALKNFWKRKCTRMLVRRWEGCFDQDAS